MSKAIETLDNSGVMAANLAMEAKIRPNKLLRGKQFYTWICDNND